MKDFDKTLKVTKALADGNRLKIVAALLEYDELCACVITEFLGIAGATASRHLSILVNAGVLASRKEGRWIHYRLSIADNLLRAWLKESLSDKANLRGLAKIVASPLDEICRKQRGISCCPVNNK
ncbi:MAG: metalloregulator ArsR/SmtB family transcription factor [Victivallaceae bacterium]